VKATTKNKFGQYFTPLPLVDHMISLATLTPEADILEPACGEGIFIKRLDELGYKNVHGFEIDATIQLKCHPKQVKFTSFISEKITKNYDLIIGNPPYIRWKNLEPELKLELQAQEIWKKYGNSLCDYFYFFIIKSVLLLKNNGQLIFICPDYWLSSTHSGLLRDFLTVQGNIEIIQQFKDTKAFDKVAASLVIFKFIKQKKEDKKIKIEDYIYSNHGKIERKASIIKNQFKLNQKWLTASDNIAHQAHTLQKVCSDSITGQYPVLSDVCHIANGMVSGLDKAFQITEPTTLAVLNDQEKQALLSVAKAHHLQPYFIELKINYIFLNDTDIKDEADFSEKYPHFYQHFLTYQDDLKSRYQYNKTIPYWQWVFPRSKALLEQPVEKIFIPCKERISNKNYLRFSWVKAGLFPTQDVTALVLKPITQESIFYLTAFLNHPWVYAWLNVHGILKGNIMEFSEKPLAAIPIRKINWYSPEEVFIHHKITVLVKKLISEKSFQYLDDIHECFSALFSIENRVHLPTKNQQQELFYDF
jgi:adenine-specific DNA-methyltransferase